MYADRMVALPRALRSAALVAGVFLAITAVPDDAFAQPGDLRGRPNPPSVEAVNLPVVFVQNVGQLPRPVFFQHRAPWGTIAVGRNGLEIQVMSAKRGADPGIGPHDSLGRGGWVRRQDLVRLRILDVARRAVPTGAGQLRARGNVYAGPHESERWTAVPLFSAVSMSGVRPGISFRLGGDRGRLTYEFALQPTADLRSLRFEVEGARGIRLDPTGFLELKTAAGSLFLGRPRFEARDRVGGRTRVLRGGYDLAGNRIGFVCPERRPTEALVIDPEISFGTFPQSIEDFYTGVSTHLASEGADRVYLCVGELPYTPGQPTSEGIETVYGYRVVDTAAPELLYMTEISELMYVHSIAADGMGRVYLGGECRKSVLPTTSQSFQPTAPPDLFKMAVVSLGPTGQLDRATYVGEPQQVDGYRISYRHGAVAVARAADGSTVVGLGGEVMISALNGLGSVNPPFPYHGPGGASPTAFAGGGEDAFFIRLSPDLSRLLSCELRGGTSWEGFWKVIAVDDGFLALGESSSMSFPTTAGAFQTTNGTGLAIGTQYEYYRTDLCVVRYSSTGPVVFATLLGGPAMDTWPTFGASRDGEAVAQFWVMDPTFPGPSHQVRALAKLSRDGSSLRFAVAQENSDSYLPTYSGVGCLSDGTPVCMNALQDPLPNVSPDAFDSHYGGGNEVLYALHDRVTGSPTYLSYLGGYNMDLLGDLAVAADDGVWACGETVSSDFPSTTGGPPAVPLGGSYIYLAKIANRPYSVTLSKSDFPDPALVDLPITYTLSVGNAQGDPIPAGTLHLIDQIPAGMSILTLPPGSVLLGPNQVRIPVPALPTGGMQALSFTVASSEPGTYLNKAKLMLGDEDLATASATTQVLPASAAPDLVLSISGPSMLPRQNLGLYNVRLRNLGEGAAMQTIVTGGTSSQKQLAIIQVDSPSATLTPTSFTWPLGTFPAGADRTLTLTLRAGDQATTERLKAQVTTGSLPGAVSSAERTVVIEGVPGNVAVQAIGGPWTVSHPYREFSIAEIMGSPAGVWPITVEAEFIASLSEVQAQGITLTAAGVFPAGTPIAVSGNTSHWVVPIVLNPEAGLPVSVRLNVPAAAAGFITNVTVRAIACIVADSDPLNNAVTVPLH